MRGSTNGVLALHVSRLIFANSVTLWVTELVWVAVVPFGFVFLALVAPALFLGSFGRWLPLGAALAVLGLILNILLFLEIASELTGEGTRPLKF